MMNFVHFNKYDKNICKAVVETNRGEIIKIGDMVAFIQKPDSPERSLDRTARLVSIDIDNQTIVLDMSEKNHSNVMTIALGEGELIKKLDTHK